MYIKFLQYLETMLNIKVNNRNKALCGTQNQKMPTNREGKVCKMKLLQCGKYMTNISKFYNSDFNAALFIDVVKKIHLKC